MHRAAESESVRRRPLLLSRLGTVSERNTMSTSSRFVAVFHGGSLRPLISAVLALLLVRAGVLAQSPAGLQIIAVQGSAVTHLVGNRRTEVPVVSIHDANN